MPRSERQRLKILYIADYLMRETDGELDEKGLPLHGVLISEIKDYLESVGIDTEKHSIRRDIDLLNGLYRDSDGNELYFDPLMDIRGGKGKPIYLGSRYLPFDDLETIVECVASANFISKNEAEELIEKLKFLCSENQANRLASGYLVAERPKYTENRMLKNLYKIRDAINHNQKVSFFYTRHSPIDTKTEKRRKGKRYVVSPFKVVLSNGNHYLIAYDDHFHQIKPYRIDRMDDVRKKDEPRDGEDKFKRMGISDYAKQTFGMFIGGKAGRITLTFENSLLDAMLERFPKSPDTIYTRIDDKHYTVRTYIVESENFYGWVCGLGEKVIITDPPETAKRFKEYIKKISENYS